MMKENEINLLYLANEDINYIATCISGWHFIVLVSFLEYLYEKEGRRLKGHVIISEHKTGTFFFNPDDYYVPEEFGMVIHLLSKEGHYIYDKGEIISKRKEKIYVITPQSTWVKMISWCKNNLSDNVEAVLLDEGVGSYNNLRHQILAAYNEDKNLKSIWVFVLRRFLFPIYIRLIHVKIDSWMMMKKSNGKIMPNQLTCKHIASIINRTVRLSDREQEPQGKYAIIVTDPFEGSVIKAHDKVEILRCIKEVKDYLEHQGIEVYIKNHPGDEGNEYKELGIKEIETEKVLETYIASIDNKPMLLCGFLSTAIVTCSCIHNIKTYFLGTYLINNYNVKGKLYKNLILSFETRYSALLEIYKREI